MFPWEEFWWEDVRKWPISFHSSPDLNFVSPKIQTQLFIKCSLDRHFVSEGYCRLNRFLFCSLLWVSHSSKLPLQINCWYFLLLFYILTHSAPKPLIKLPASWYQNTVFCFCWTTRFQTYWFWHLHRKGNCPRTPKNCWKRQTLILKFKFSFSHGLDLFHQCRNLKVHILWGALDWEFHQPRSGIWLVMIQKRLANSIVFCMDSSQSSNACFRKTTGLISSFGTSI